MNRKLNLYLFAAVITIITLNSYSQIKFQSTIGGTGDDIASYIIQTSDSGYAIAGYTNSFGTGSYDFYIVKLNSRADSIEWSRTIGGAGSDYPLKIFQTSDGGYIVSGESNSFTSGNYDVLLVRLTSSGNIIWGKTFGGSGEDYGEAVVQTTNGNFVIAGYTSSFGAGDFDSYICKLSSAGNLISFNTIGGTGYDYSLSIKKTTDSGFLLFGSTSNNGAGFNDYLITKTDSNGTLMWNKQIGGAGGDYGFSAIQTSDSGYAAVGTSLSFGAGNYDIYVVRFDGSGNLLWTKTIGGANNENGYSIIQTTDGGFAVCGSTNSYGAGGYDAYVVKLSVNGNLVWSKTFGGANDDYFMSIAPTMDGGFVTAGYTYSFGAGNADFFVVKFDAAENTCGSSSLAPSQSSSGGIVFTPDFTTNTYSIAVNSPQLTVDSGGVISSICPVGIVNINSNSPVEFQLFQNYPNPFNPSTKIKFEIPTTLNPHFQKMDKELSSGKLIRLVVYDAIGRQVSILVNEMLNPGTYEYNWDASNEPAGIYFYELAADDFRTAKKMVLVK